MVFLVGGAGNGKSKLAADAVGNVDGTLQGDASEFAQRTYAYELAAGGCLRVINDATIPPADKHVAPLVRDLSDVINSGDHLLACEKWCRLQESNPRPTDYKSAALPTELSRPLL